MIVGNDISKYQGVVDWPTFKNNSNFVIVKSSEGNGFTDPKFVANQKGARGVGLPLGYYHFARPDLGNTPEAEADWFLKVIGEPVTGEVYCLDFEPNWNGDAVTWCKNFLSRVQTTTGVKCFIYLNQSQLKAYNWSPIVNEKFPLWLAAYTGNPNSTNYFKGQWPQVFLLQWTSTQTVPGIVGNVDGDAFSGTADEFKKYGYIPPIPPEPVPTPPTCDELIKEAIIKAKADEAQNWQTQLDTANTQIEALKKLTLEPFTIAIELISAGMKKLWIWRKSGGGN